MVLQFACWSEHSRFDVEVNELSSRDPASSHESLPQGNFCDRPFFGDVLSDNNSVTRHIKSATGHKFDHWIETYNDRPSLDQQKKLSEALSSFLHGHEDTSADKENTARRQLDLQATSSSTAVIQASPASDVVQHNQVAVFNNMHENHAHGEQGQHRFPPQFNFYNCTNVQVHNNFSASG